MLMLACDLHWPVLHEFAESIQSLWELVSGGGEAKSKMRRSIETLPWGEQNSMFSCSLAERPGVFSADKPGKCRHPSLRTNPLQRFAMLSHKAIQLLQVQGCDFLCFPEN